MLYNLPWFTKNLPTPISDDTELRLICTNYTGPLLQDDVPLEPLDHFALTLNS